MASKNLRWLVDSGILRKKNTNEEDPQELLVFGYSCKLFRDDEKAKMIDHGKHLIPWMGDSTLKIDRYDGRGALADLRSHEPPPGGFDVRTILTEDELKVEQLCDEERYRSIYNNDAEELMYHEEEMKRLQQALGSDNTYGQVAYNYDEDSQPAGDDSQSPKPSEGSQEEEDQAFVPPPELEIPEGMALPDTQKLNAIITKTALFISRQGSQMEILIKTKQANNPQFSFLTIDGYLNPYYRLVLEAIKAGKYNPEKQPEKEEPESDEESDDNDEPYLHPSLASSLTKVEAAPSIPSIHYKPSADCAYSMLVNKITGKPPTSRVPPPPPPPENVPIQQIPATGYYPSTPIQGYMPYLPAPQQYSHGPVIYGPNGQVQSPPRVSSIPGVLGSIENPQTPTPKEISTPLVPYGPTPPKPLSRPSFIVPPTDVQIIIDKMASYVAKNGRDFEAIVKAKGDPRFNFLELSHQYHGYYAHKLTIYEGAVNPKVLTEEELLRRQEPQEEKQKKLEELQKKQQRMEEVQKRVKMIQAKKKSDKQITTVSFSIKKPKEGDGSVMEKRSALPIEESDEEVDDEKKENSLKSNSALANAEESKTVKPVFDKDLEEKSAKLVNKANVDDRELVDLTDDILDNVRSQGKMRVDEKFKDKTTFRGDKSVNSRERQLQLERKKKAAMFLSQIQAPTLVKSNSDPKTDNDSDEVHSIPSPSLLYEVDESRSNNNSLMNRLKSVDTAVKRSRPRSGSRSRSSGSRSRSRSRSHSHHSDRHRSSKKHKKKKSSHKSYDSPSTSKTHKTKKSKKSYVRHRSRSRSSSRKYQSTRHSSKNHSDFNDSGSNSS